MLELTPDQVADAETVGVSFPPATPQQIQRLAMQRKVFRVGGEAVLATRGGALFETAATLERLIVEGGRQRRDLARWEAVAPEPEAETPAPPGPAVDRAPPPSATAGPRKGRRGERWLTAGAERRGRVAQHWSRRRA